MANTFVGIGLLWGFPGGPTASTTTLLGLGSLAQIQGLDFSRKAQKDQIKGPDGITTGVVYSDHEDSASIDFVIHNTTVGGSLTAGAIPTCGAIITLTDSNFTPIAAPWLLDDISVVRSNTKAATAKLTLSRYIGGTSALP